MPQLADPNFFQTTSIISTFNQEGAMGIVLNRPLDLTLGKVLEGTTEVEKSIQDQQVYWGGPVQNSVGWLLHEDETLMADSIQIIPNLYLSASSKALKKLVAPRGVPPSARFRFYLGYAGWGPGQLEQEIAASSWVTAPIDRKLIFQSTAEQTWQESLKSIGVDPISLAFNPHGQAN